jgi:hypothetical protein
VVGESVTMKVAHEEEEEEILFIYCIRLPVGAEGSLVLVTIHVQAEVRFKYESGSFFV